MNSLIPQYLEEWDISIIDKLSQLSNIESETFDFKVTWGVLTFIIYCFYNSGVYS